ncbi:hypothetical protein [Arthrobacter sp. Soil763]|uniref:hypothetical protein n=1 Tax=Arthrobacter sp. Soil763 TaxID=1736402 RepID=UPI0006FF10BE|nr:hypothetical protein [Arthrobacter sp. Soil763]KRE81687.1 hypothetical protein ASG71_01020 [Arthrobacter sp. Soil763]
MKPSESEPAELVWATNWLGLPAGAPVTVRRPGRAPVGATVELATPDGKILWVRYRATSERVMLHKADGTQVWCDAPRA